MPTGKVKNFFDDKGFGFILPDDGSDDVFVHRRVYGDGQDRTAYLEAGDAVDFQVEWDSRRGKFSASSCTGPWKTGGGGCDRDRGGGGGRPQGKSNGKTQSDAVGAAPAAPARPRSEGRAGEADGELHRALSGGSDCSDGAPLARTTALVDKRDAPLARTAAVGHPRLGGSSSMGSASLGSPAADVAAAAAGHARLGGSSSVGSSSLGSPAADVAAAAAGPQPWRGGAAQGPAAVAAAEPPEPLARAATAGSQDLSSQLSHRSLDSEHAQLEKDLSAWLAALGLPERLSDAVRWCDREGAVFLEEVADPEHVTDLIAFLELPEDEARRVAEKGQEALVRVLGHTVRPTCSTCPWSSWRCEPGLGLGARTLSALTARVPSGAEHGAVDKNAIEGAGEGARGPALGLRKPVQWKALHVQAGQDGLLPRAATQQAPLREDKILGPGEAGLPRTATCTMQGPLAGIMNSLPLGAQGAGQELQVTPLRKLDTYCPQLDDQKLTPAALQARETRDAERLEGTVSSSLGGRMGRTSSIGMGIRRADTMQLAGIVPMEQAALAAGGDVVACSSRERLNSRVHEKNVLPVSLDHGQTGDVFALTVGDEKIAIFKPVRGEHFERKSLRTGQGWVREESVYLVDRLCGSQAGVPVTSRGTIEVGGETLEGSVQAFVSDVIGFIEDFAMPRDPAKANEFVAQTAAEALAMLDMRVFNMDRHSGNLLLLKDASPHLLGPIDHGCCLPPWWCLGEANFEAWQDWSQLSQPPSDHARQIARNATERLDGTCHTLSNVGLEAPAIVTLRLCTLFLRVGVFDLGLPLGRLAALMVRGDGPGIGELSWLEAQVLQVARAAGSSVREETDDRYGDKELVVEGEDEGLDVGAFLDGLESVFRRELPVAAALQGATRY